MYRKGRRLLETVFEVRVSAGGNSKVTFTGQVWKEEEEAIQRWLLACILEYKKDPRKCQKKLSDTDGSENETLR